LYLVLNDCVLFPWNTVEWLYVFQQMSPFSINLCVHGVVQTNKDIFIRSETM